jgi:signal transduction histidine kinase
MIAVTDHGIGIPDTDKQYLFSRFYRAQNVTNIQGTGLGLTIVKRYVELMSGMIKFNSELNKGSTFTIMLPLTISKSR